MEKTRSFDGLFIGFLAGGAIGVLAGLLFAPKSGKELRTDIWEKGAGLYGDTKEMFSDAQVRTRAVIDDAKTKADELKRGAVQRLSDARLKACKALNCGEEAQA